MSLWARTYAAHTSMEPLNEPPFIRQACLKVSLVGWTRSRTLGIECRRQRLPLHSKTRGLAQAGVRAPPRSVAATVARRLPTAVGALLAENPLTPPPWPPLCQTSAGVRLALATFCRRWILGFSLCSTPPTSLGRLAALHCVSS